MDEQEILNKLTLHGDQEEKAVKRIHEVMTSWGLKLPDVPIYPVHFGFNDFYHIGETEINVNNNVEEGFFEYLLAVLEIHALVEL